MQQTGSPSIRSRRAGPEVQAQRSATLLDDPYLKAKFDEVRNMFIRDIEFAKLDGSEKSANAVLESVRQLQALAAVKAAIIRPLVQEKIKQQKVRRSNRA